MGTQIFVRPVYPHNSVYQIFVIYCIMTYIVILSQLFFTTFFIILRLNETYD